MSPFQAVENNEPIKSQINYLINAVEKNSTISNALYDKYNVKRGLRNANGTGVLVGITRICNVLGYEIHDGAKIPIEGELHYRGINVADIVAGFQKEHRYGYEEVIYLLLFGDLPTEKQLQDFRYLLSMHQNLPSKFKEEVILGSPSRNIMNKLQRTILTLYSYDADADDTSIANVLEQSIDLIAKLPLLMSYSYQAKTHYFDNQSLVIHNPMPDKSIAENIIHLCRDDGEIPPEESALLDLLLVVQAEHGGGNNSTFATQVVSSTGTDTYSAISAAIGSLKGPRHGGANIMVKNMVEHIKEHVQNWEDKEDVKSYLRKILNKEVYDKKGLVYGMGHAVYTKSDPRAVLLKVKAKEVAEEKGYERQYALLANIEQGTKELYQELKGEDAIICANVDLYSGLVFEMLNIPPELYTPLFAIARTAGWCAHRLEQVADSKIIRPAFITLSDMKEYTPLKDRVPATYN